MNNSSLSSGGVKKYYRHAFRGDSHSAEEKVWDNQETQRDHAFQALGLMG